MEKREYGPDSTEAEIEMLKSRVQLLDNGVIFFNGPRITSEFQIEVMWGEAKKLIVEGEDNYFLIDLVDTAPPKAKQRAKVKEQFRLVSKHVRHAGLYTGQNRFMNLVAKFILGGAAPMEHSIHMTREQAIKAIEDARNR